MNRLCENEVLWRVKEERNILHTIKRAKINLIAHILPTNCVQKHIIEGKIEETGRQERWRNQLLDDLKETKNHWQLKEEALNRTVGNSFRKRLWTCRKTDYVMRFYMETVCVRFQRCALRILLPIAVLLQGECVLFMWMLKEKSLIMITFSSVLTNRVHDIGLCFFVIWLSCVCYLVNEQCLMSGWLLLCTGHHNVFGSAWRCYYV